jgi:hypothetical protein
VQPGSIGAGEGSNESKQPKEPKRPGDPDRGREGDDVDPVALQVVEPAARGENARPEFEDEEAGEDELGDLDLRPRTGGRLDVVDDEPERDVHDRQRGREQLPATSCVTNQPLKASRSGGRTSVVATSSAIR